MRPPFCCVLLTSLPGPIQSPMFAGLRYSSTSSAGPSLQLVAELRRHTNVTIQKAREALMASNGNISGALAWLEDDQIVTRERKAEKLGTRSAKEGLVGVSLLSRGNGHADNLGVRAAMVEVNCETDFVGRNDLFRVLTRDLAFTAAFVSDSQRTINRDRAFLYPIDHSHLLGAPLMIRDQDEKKPPKTVSQAIKDVIVAVGENISIRRAVAFTRDPIPPASGLSLRAASYVHGSLSSLPEKTSSLAITEAQGKIGALVAIGLKTSPAYRLRELLQSAEFSTKLSILERALARQIVGFRPQCVRGETESALYSQSFDVLPTSGGQSVEKVLSEWAIEQSMVDGSPSEDEVPAGLGVLDFARWEVGEEL